MSEKSENKRTPKQVFPGKYSGPIGEQQLELWGAGGCTTLFAADEGKGCKVRTEEAGAARVL